jgi:hypothetical protein
MEITNEDLHKIRLIIGLYYLELMFKTDSDYPNSDDPKQKRQDDVEAVLDAFERAGGDRLELSRLAFVATATAAAEVAV